MQFTIEYLNKHEAKEAMDAADGKWSVLQQELTPFYTNLSYKLFKEYMNIKDYVEKTNKKSKSKYMIDYLFGLYLYENLEELFQGKFNNRIASNTDFWIYLSVYVVPHVVSDRWGPNAYDHFYKMDRRVWLSTIWSYINLTWQGTREETIKIIDDFNTDTILNLVERVYTGYDLNLSRSLMKNLSLRINELSGKMLLNDFFRAVMVQNTVYLSTMEPASFDNIDEYTNMLIDVILQKEV